MADFTYVYEDLAIGGGIFTPQNMATIASDGFTHIINCQCEWDDKVLADAHGIKVLWCPVYDDGNAPDEIHFERAAQFVEQTLLADPEHTKLLVHCAAGVHRGAMFALLAAMICGQNSDEVVRQIYGTRIIASFLTVYRNAVEDFVAKRNTGK